jgi:hypothetical protein
LTRLLRYAFAGVAAILFVARICAQSSTEQTPEANPGRPTVSTPATLTPVGYLQFENGGLYAETSPEFKTLFGINQVTKLTVASRLQLLALAEPLLKQVERPAMLSQAVAPARSSPDFRRSYCPGRGTNLP